MMLLNDSSWGRRRRRSYHFPAWNYESLLDAQMEFVSIFQEGKELADQSEILEQPAAGGSLNPETLYYGQGAEEEKLSFSSLELREYGAGVGPLVIYLGPCPLILFIFFVLLFIHTCM